MNLKFKNFFEALKKNPKVLKKNLHGFERECLRVNHDGELSQKPHPQKLGSKLTNKYITTDFSEAQLELITPPFTSLEKAIYSLEDIHLFVVKNLGDELLWPFSMPSKLPKEKNIPIAYFGTSDSGKRKYIYRKGLSVRYGRKMQTISGIHYNFSFSEEFWDLLYKTEQPQKTRKDFIAECYFRIIRNFLRHRCVISYLFGATPVVDKTYLNERPRNYLKKLDKNTYYAPYGTSLRTSLLGYNSKVQHQLFIRYDSLNSYIHDLRYAVTTKNPAYTKLGLEKKGEPVQLNDNLLQSESEHYSSIRPKQLPKNNETVLEALEKRGVQYIEVRAIDIDPLNPLGVNKEAILFVQIFLLYCLFKESPRITHHEGREIMKKQNDAAMYGRNGMCNENNMKILPEMKELAEIMNKNSTDNIYSEILNKQIEKIKNSELTPSAKIIKHLKKSKKSYLQYGLDLAKQHENYFKNKKLSAEKRKKFIEESKKSLREQEDLEVRSEMYLKGYENLEGSTQMMIKEAQKRGIDVEVLDPITNFISLKKGRKLEYVRQGNMTSKNPEIGYFIMENKFVTKKILEENGINVPRAELYTNIEKAVSEYGKFSKSKIVVKPNSTNYGISIHFIEKNTCERTARARNESNNLALPVVRRASLSNKKEFENALKDSFKYDKSVLVEEFFEGKEYRFLVIGGRVVSVLYRRPASVMGDGVHTIKELVQIKNAIPRAYKNNTGYVISLGETEKDVLKKQKLNVESIPRKGERIFLRENSNIHTGGDPIDLTDKMDKSYKIIADLAAKSVGAKICGVDMIVKNINEKADKKNHTIIELNFNPAMQMHKFVVEGQGRAVEKDILDFLGF